MRLLLVLLLAVGACSATDAESGQATTPDSRPGLATEVSADTDRGLVDGAVFYTAMSELSVPGEEREHFMAPALPPPVEVQGYDEFEHDRRLPFVGLEPGCGDEAALRGLWSLHGLSLKASGEGRVLDIGVGLTGWDWRSDQRPSFADIADSMVRSVAESIDGCPLEGGSGEVNVVDPGAAIDGARESLVWTAATDAGYVVSAQFSMDNGFVGSVRLSDETSPVGYDEIRDHAEDLVNRQPELIDRVNGCLERDSRLFEALEVVFVAEPGTPELPQSGEECGDLSFDYLDYRSFSVDGSWDQVSRIEMVSKQVIPVGKQPRPGLLAGGMLWVPNAGDGSVSVIDTSTRDVAATISVGDAPTTPIAVGDAVWVPNEGADTVSVIDMESLVVSSLRVGQSPTTPVVVEGLVWVPTSDSLTIVDPATFVVVGQVPGSFSVPSIYGWSSSPLVVGGMLWIPQLPWGHVSVVDIETRRLVETIDVGEWPRTPAVVEDRVWVPNNDDGTISVIEVDTREVVATIEVGGRPETPVVADGLAWVPTYGGVTVVDPRTFEVIKSVKGGREPAELDGILWFPTGSGVRAIDIGRRRFHSAFSVGGELLRPVVAEGRVWLPDQANANVVVLQPRLIE